MPTPLPTSAGANLSPPGAGEVRVLSRGVISAVAPDEGLSLTQRALVTAVFKAMTGYEADLSAPPIEADEIRPIP